MMRHQVVTMFILVADQHRTRLSLRRTHTCTVTLSQCLVYVQLHLAIPVDLVQDSFAAGNALAR